jgi:hypothetical protein
MTKRYLLICGGTGVGLVDKRTLSDMDGLVQFDVASDAEEAKDSLTYNFEFPFSGDSVVFNIDALNKQIELLNNEKSQKELLLELVKKGHIEKITKYEELQQKHQGDLEEYKKLSRIVNDISSAQQLKTAATLRVREIEPNVTSLMLLESELSSDDIPYLTTLREIEAIRKKIKLLSLVRTDLPTTSLADGMSQMPMIGSAYVNREVIRDKINRTFDSLTAIKAPMASEPIVVYVVSSMCGGTGQGVSQFIGETAVAYFNRKVPTTRVTLNFIRVGAWTYNQIGAAMDQKTNINAAMAVLHDAALAYKQLNNQNAVGLNAEYQFFYIETPDVGRNRVLRRQDVELACRAILNKQIAADFQAQFNNIQNDWFKGLFARVGYWANEVDSLAIYRETLDQLNEKISELLVPDTRTIVENTRYELQPNQALLAWRNSPNVIEQTEPRELKTILRTSVGTFNPDEKNLIQLIGTQKFDATLNVMTDFISKYIGTSNLSQCSYDFRVGPNDPTAALDLVLFESRIAEKNTAQFIRDIRRAHEVKSMAVRLLAGGGSESSAISRLIKAWAKMVPSIVDGNSTVNSKVRNNIRAFVDEYVLVKKLMETIKNSEAIITDAKEWMTVLVEYVKDQRSTISTQQHVTLTSSAELEDRQDDSTWLYTIRSVLLGDLNSASVKENFKSAVCRGSRGLTKDGLRHVMEIPIHSSISQVVEELNTHVGKLKVDDNEYQEALWWQGLQFASAGSTNLRFKYRVLPPLPESEKTAIFQQNINYGSSHFPQAQDSFKYIVAEDSFAGLKVLAVECVRDQTKQLVHELLNPLIDNLRIKGSDKDTDKYIRRLAGSSNGEAIYLTDQLNRSITGGVLDLKDYFSTVGEE